MSLSLIITVVGVFIAVALAAGSLASFALTSTATERKRLRAATRSSVTALPEVRSLAAARGSGSWQRIAAMLPKSPKELERLRVRLLRAGFASPGAPVIYTLLEIILPLAGGALAFSMVAGQRAYFAAVFAALVLYFLPGM